MFIAPTQEPVDVSISKQKINYDVTAVRVAQWLSSRALDLQSLDRGFDSHSGQLRSNLGQVVHTYVPLSPSSITWYRSRNGDVLRLGRRPQAWQKVMAAYRQG